MDFPWFSQSVRRSWIIKNVALSWFGMSWHVLTQKIPRMVSKPFLGPCSFGHKEFHHRLARQRGGQLLLRTQKIVCTKDTADYNIHVISYTINMYYRKLYIQCAHNVVWLLNLGTGIRCTLYRRIQHGSWLHVSILGFALAISDHCLWHSMTVYESLWQSMTFYDSLWQSDYPWYILRSTVIR